jgi:hypothetical protein
MSRKDDAHDDQPHADSHGADRNIRTISEQLKRGQFAQLVSTSRCRDESTAGCRSSPEARARPVEDARQSRDSSLERAWFLVCQLPIPNHQLPSFERPRCLGSLGVGSCALTIQQPLRKSA